MIKDATISPCGRYRYRLTRNWGPEWVLPFVMLNPSTADASKDDPTIRRCIGFARREFAGGIVVANLYAFRATSPAEMLKESAAFGPDNLDTLTEIARYAERTGAPIVCAWGTLGGAMAQAALNLFRDHGARSACLGKTEKGHPRHPLYVKADQPLVPL